MAKSPFRRVVKEVASLTPRAHPDLRSGSAMLNDQGHLVGMLLRGPNTAEDQLEAISALEFPKRRKRLESDLDHARHRDLSITREFQGLAATIHALVGTYRLVGKIFTLTEARRAVLFSRLWLKSDKDQAQSRIHRSGHTHEALVVRYVAYGAVDMRAIRRQEENSGLKALRGSNGSQRQRTGASIQRALRSPQQ
ncbi:MAG: hypothetical protein M1826_005803 [Phylliscum demangeonii]|nr:MAG: hypothetical protein M1826_005803 [Phylliscum demangeonii]